MSHPDTSTTYHVIGSNGLLGLPHDTENKAEAAALRAANHHPNTTFTIVMVVSTVMVPSIPQPIIMRYT